MTTLNSGSMRTRVTFQRPSATRGSRGERTGDAEVLGTRDCRLEWLSGRKLELARQVFARANIRLDLRKPFAFHLTPQDQAVYGDTILTIGSIIPSDEKFDDIIVLCEVEQ
jgi:head-tail adaptor